MSDKGSCEDFCSLMNRQFVVQSEWTKDFRLKIYKDIGLKNARRVLEVGCGNGVITQELRENSSAQITAIDKDHLAIAEAQQNIDGVEFYRMKADSLSMRDETYDIIICHHFFLWLKKPFKTLMEMYRVCKKGGLIVALAEPDYGGWLEQPDYGLGKQHISCLENEEADPYIGRKLLSLMSSAGLENKLYVEAQIWDKKKLEDTIDKEWNLVLEAGKITKEEYDEILNKEKRAIKNNLRMVYLPIFAVSGRKVDTKIDEKELEVDILMKLDLKKLADEHTTHLIVEKIEKLSENRIKKIDSKEYDDDIEISMKANNIERDEILLIINNALKELNIETDVFNVQIGNPT